MPGRSAPRERVGFACSPLLDLPGSWRTPGVGEWSEPLRRRPVLIFSLIGTVVSQLHSLAMAHSFGALVVSRELSRRPVRRQHLDGARLRRRRHRTEGIARAAYGLLGAPSVGFIFGPGLERECSLKISYTAPIWAAAGITLHAARPSRGSGLPETVHRAQARVVMPLRTCRKLPRRPNLGGVS